MGKENGGVSKLSVTLVLSLVIAIAGFAFGYGNLTNRVSAAESEINNYRDDLKSIKSDISIIKNTTTETQVELRMHMGQEER